MSAYVYERLRTCLDSLDRPENHYTVRFCCHGCAGILAE